MAYEGKMRNLQEEVAESEQKTEQKPTKTFKEALEEANIQEKVENVAGKAKEYVKKVYAYGVKATKPRELDEDEKKYKAEEYAEEKKYRHEQKMARIRNPKTVKESGVSYKNIGKTNPDNISKDGGKEFMFWDSPFSDTNSTPRNTNRPSRQAPQSNPIGNTGGMGLSNPMGSNRPQRISRNRNTRPNKEVTPNFFGGNMGGNSRNPIGNMSFGSGSNPLGTTRKGKKKGKKSQDTLGLEG